MVRPILCKDKKLSNRPPLLIPSGGGFFEVAIVPYVSRIRPVCLIPLSNIHRSHLVCILNVTIGCMADAWRIDPITPPHRDHTATSSRPHRDLTATTQYPD